MRTQRGISKVEFAVAAALTAIFSGFLLERLVYYESVSERAYFDLTVRAVKSGLRWRTAELLTGQQPVDYDRLAAENPIGWLDSPPDQYAGLCACSSLEAGAWGYDPDKHILCYHPSFASAFDELLDNGDKRLSISMNLIYNDDKSESGGIDFIVSSVD